MTITVSRQVRRAEERHVAKVDAAEGRVYDRIAIRKAKKLTPLDTGVVREPYPADRYQPFRPTGKDWKAIATEKERAKHAGAAKKAVGGVRKIVAGVAAAVLGAS